MMQSGSVLAFDWQPDLANEPALQWTSVRSGRFGRPKKCAANLSRAIT
jgi:hypothetical protein